MWVLNKINDFSLASHHLEHEGAREAWIDHSLLSDLVRGVLMNSEEQQIRALWPVLACPGSVTPSQVGLAF